MLSSPVPSLSIWQTQSYMDQTSCEAADVTSIDSRRWLVPESIMQKESARCFDVLNGSCHHSLCFTKAYGRYIDGTGSVLELPCRLAEPSEEAGEYTMRDWYGKLRYLSPKEVARLLGFKFREESAASCSGCLPECKHHRCPARESQASCRCSAFDLPEVEGPADARELWALLGNSLNPQVVALVCRACGLKELGEKVTCAD
eukprot:TRINITY_DN9765_c0_g1_i4.p1 TRINITY_DN9765_c0_g1~~TRINITY_DN9765_c0_g1_i4.p1  ORF type:complete len:202 (-),score=33.55 TRINITY_DN9765_c0_g1_i4:62-667(-)